MSDDDLVPWTPGRPGQLLVFRVNRRPLGEGGFLPTTLPTDVFRHFVQVLAPGYPVVTGRGNQRVSRVGGLDVNYDARLITGKMGWQPYGQEQVLNWSEEEKDWVTRTEEPRESRLIPFAFDGDSRILSALKDSQSAPETVAAAFEKILRENEKELQEPTTEWSVEPILDTREFLDWLGSLDVVRSVKFTARLPNPEPDEDFEELWGRLEKRHATEFSGKFKSDRDEGLVDVEEDPEVRQAIAMGSKGFATLTGTGTREGRASEFNQEDEVARERVDELPATWGEMRGLLGDFVKDRARRFLDGRAA